MTELPLQTAGLARAGATAVLVAALLLLVFILPAEYGIDPLGSGRALGLNRLASANVQAHNNQSSPWRSDSVRFVLDPFASIEYKYPLNSGDSFVYHWRASGELVFDFHSEEKGKDPEDALSFLVGRQQQADGAYTAAFDGIHGWFWENRTSVAVELTLDSAGHFTDAILYEGGMPTTVTISASANAEPSGK